MSARVLIAGGGVASIETALALQDLARDRVTVEVCSPRKDFAYRPFAVGDPYGAAEIPHYDLEDLAGRCGATFRLESIASVEADAQQAISHDKQEIPYDYLVVACGARLLWPLPGVTTFWGLMDEADIESVIGRMQDGSAKRVVFALPGTNSWGLPIYELALLAETEMRKAHVDAPQLTVVSPEEAPLQVFGKEVSAKLSQLLSDRGIAVRTGAHIGKFEQGRLSITPGEDLEADAVLSLPRMEGRQIDGVAHDQNGFIGVDAHCRVPGMSNVFAAGDVTTFPVKQGGIAAQQADVIAEAIAADLGCDLDPKPFEPVLRGVLWTGEEPRYLYGHLTGGHGETSSMTEEPPWEPQEGKIMSRYLSPFLSEIDDQIAK
jgi:sulfide:quinone oxidoreductase